ncbi:MAG: electron transport complex subunit E [Ruminococcaceae bacterium]|nr:electron transport complex subunit E [Oscillospiraceae bacterium]
MKEKVKILTNGFLNENPVLRLVLGTCPTLAISVSAEAGVGMGLATFVLICSNMVISALRKVIPDKVRIPAFITIIASFVTIVQMIVQAFLPSLNDSLGIYLPLIVVNCIILGRAEMFASKNPVFDSMLDGLGMGIGFTIALLVMGTIREIIGAGTFFGIRLFPESYALGIMTSAPGGFFTFGCLIALLTAILASKGKKLIKSENKCLNCSGDCTDCGEVEK